jgi:hypothetical protein
MDLYHVFCDLKPGVGDIAFSEQVTRYMGYLTDKKLIESWRLTRRKLGLGAPGLGEFHLLIEVKNLAQLDAAFNLVASRRDPVETFHHGLNSLVQNATFSLYRDFPDPVRHHGEERF